MSRQFDRAFNGFRPRVRQEDALLGGSGRELREPLAQRGEALIVKIAAADVQKPGSRFLHRVYDFGMPVARGSDRDAGHEIEEAIAVDIFHHRALPARDRQRVFLGIRSGRPAILPFDDRAGLGARRRHDDAGIVAGRGHTRAFSVATVFSSAVASRPTISSISDSVMMNGGAINAASPLVPSA